jgi:hypothetical protein
MAKILAIIILSIAPAIPRFGCDQGFRDDRRHVRDGSSGAAAR